MLLIDRSKVEVPSKVRFWGQESARDPRFVEQALGNGEQLVAIQPLSTRPHYYVIRIDSSWHLYGCKCPDDCPDVIQEHLDEIYEAIEDEYGEKDSVRYSNSQLEDGQEPDSDEWPVLDLDCGTAWFSIDPREFAAADSPGAGH